MADPVEPDSRWQKLKTWGQSPQAIALTFMVGLFGGMAFYVTQPLFWTGRLHTPANAAPERLKAHVKTLCGDMGSRAWWATTSLDATARYIAKELNAAGGRVEEQVFQVRGKTYRNVIAHFGPEGGKRLVLGAHYDTCEGLPGADDNTSGVAALLELGRMMGEQTTLVPVDLVAYTLEEPPFFRTQDMGSARHAEFLRSQGIQLIAMISIEMIGTFSDEPDSQHFPLPGAGLLYPSKGNFIAVIGGLGDARLVRRIKAGMARTCAVPVHSMNAPRAIAGIDFSDHLNYWNRGFPAVMVTDTAFFRNPRYHTASDTPDRLDYDRMAQVVEGLFGVVETLSSN